MVSCLVRSLAVGDILGKEEGCRDLLGEESFCLVVGENERGASSAGERGAFDAGLRDFQGRFFWVEGAF